MALTIVRLPSSSQLASYLTQASASTTYLTQVSASTNYLTKSSASTTYLTQASASTTYALIIPATNTTFRNVLINGDFYIDQRNSGASQTITSTNAYTADRWYANAAGANVTGARIAGAVPTQYYYRFTGATSNTQVTLAQRIEAANSYHMAGQTVTISAKIASSSLTSITWGLGYATATDNFAVITSGPSGTFTINSTLTTYSATFTVPAGATTGLRFLLQTATGLVASQTLTIADVQLELGSIATPFEQRPIGIELALCQRYYQNIAIPTGTTDFNLPIVRESATQAQMTVFLPVTLRSSPSIIGTNYGRCVFRDTAFNVLGAAVSGISLNTSGGPSLNAITLILTHSSVAGTYVFSEWDTLNTTTNIGLQAEI
jgi:hypothetical protein